MAIENKGELNISGGIIKGNIRNEGTFYISGNTQLMAEKSVSTGITSFYDGCLENYGYLNISDSVRIVTDYYVGIYNNDAGSIEATGGYIESDAAEILSSKPYAIYNNGGTVTLTSNVTCIPENYGTIEIIEDD